MFPVPPNYSYSIIPELSSIELELPTLSTDELAQGSIFELFSKLTTYSIFSQYLIQHLFDPLD